MLRTDQWTEALAALAHEITRPTEYNTTIAITI